MAVAIRQQPQSPNAAFGTLPYVVSGSNPIKLDPTNSNPVLFFR